MADVWKLLAWISAGWSALHYAIGWASVLAKTEFFGVPAEFYFYDAIGTAVFAVFFLMYSAHSRKGG